MPESSTWVSLQWLITMLLIPTAIWVGKEVRTFLDAERRRADAVTDAYLAAQKELISAAATERERAWETLDEHTAVSKEMHRSIVAIQDNLLELGQWLKEQNGSHSRSG